LASVFAEELAEREQVHEFDDYLDEQGKLSGG
jgi:hypothetical protein